MTLSTMFLTMAAGMLRTCGIFALTLLGSLPLGMIVALLKKSRFSAVRALIDIYISVIRGTPLMLQLLVWYFGPYYLFGWSIRGWRFPSLIIGFVLNYAAYLPRSTEAASSLSRLDSMRRRRCLDTPKPRRLCASFCRRSSSGSCPL